MAARGTASAGRGATTTETLVLQFYVPLFLCLIHASLLLPTLLTSVYPPCFCPLPFMAPTITASQLLADCSWPLIMAKATITRYILDH